MKSGWTSRQVLYLKLLMLRKSLMIWILIPYEKSPADLLNLFLIS